ncbi:bromodomain-containing protein C631.02-like [Dendronephthya gigantea]|uniref:bromodomain-containing protein C631.02-like n=1 Tax=Dendronephthya gigantea TaxID=151771 RepID=UPI00106CFCBF|nr:bromodomain-containing protein C631.02-like [Dendronephthya gigantea]
MCCMCVKELPPGELARNSIEPIDGVASVLKERLDNRIRELDLVSQSIHKRIEASDESISSAVECARSEVRRFFTALNLLLNKQEESFQHQLTSLLHTTTSRPIFNEMRETSEAIDELVEKGKGLLCEDNLVVSKKFDHISRVIDELLLSDNVNKFPSPTLQVSINVHRHLLEMVRHPGYISTTFDECRASRNVVYKSEQKPNKFDESVEENFDAKEKDDVGETFPTPPQVSICSPPISVTGEDDETPYPLMPRFSRNSSPMLSSPEEDMTLRPLAVNNVNNENEQKGVCSCRSNESLDSETPRNTKDAKDLNQKTDGNHDPSSKCKENKSVKRKLSEKSLLLPFPRKSRRTEASKELNLCDKLLTELWVSDDSFPFARPVDPKKVPKYYEIIKNPIDLTAIKTKLQTINYDSVYDFVDDMKLLFDNCYLFNPQNTSIYQNGVNLEKQFMTLLRANFPTLYYQSSIPENNV